MNRKLVVIIFTVLLNSCELIVIGTKTTPQVKEFVDYNQKTPLGTIYLFKAELDSNNISAASELLAASDGRFLAYQRYEKFDEVSRFKRMMSLKEITDVEGDKISENLYKYKLEFDYRRTVTFVTNKISNNWFITDMEGYERQ